MSDISRVTIGNVLEGANSRGFTPEQTADAVRVWRDDSAKAARDKLGDDNDTYFKAIDALDDSATVALHGQQQQAIQGFLSSRLKELIPNDNDRADWAKAVSTQPPDPDLIGNYDWSGGNKDSTIDPDAATEAYKEFGRVSGSRAFRPMRQYDWQLIRSNDGAALADWKSYEKGGDTTEVAVRIPDHGTHSVLVKKATPERIQEEIDKTQKEFTRLSSDLKTAEQIGGQMFGGLDEPEKIQRDLNAVSDRLRDLKDPRRAASVVMGDELVENLRGSKLGKSIGKKDLLEDIGRGLVTGWMNIREGLNDMAGDAEEVDALRAWTTKFRREHPGSTAREFQGGFGGLVKQAAEGLGGMAPTLIPGAAGARIPKIGHLLSGRLLTMTPLAVQSYGGNLSEMLNDADAEDAAGRPDQAKMLRENAREAAIFGAMADVGTEMMLPEERLTSLGLRGGRVARAVKGVGTTAAQNFAEEAGAAALSELYKPTLQGREGDPVLESGLVGALSGAPLGVAQALGGSLSEPKEKKPPDPLASIPESGLAKIQTEADTEGLIADLDALTKETADAIEEVAPAAADALRELTQDQPGDSATNEASLTATDEQRGSGAPPGNVLPNETEAPQPEQTEGLATGIETGTETEAAAPAAVEDLDPFATTQSPPTESPIEEPMPLDGESSVSAELNSSGAPDTRTPEADVAPVVNIKETTSGKKVKSEKKRPPEEEFTWVAEDPDAPIKRSTSRATGSGRRRPTAEDGAAAMERISKAAPEVAKNVRIIQGHEELNEADYALADWSLISDGKSDGFFNTSTGETIVMLNNLSPRFGETTQDAVKRVILHERLSHAGLTILRGDPEFSSTWNKLVSQIPKAELEPLRRLYPGMNDDVLAEEWLAKHAERARLAPPDSLLGKMWQAIKDFIAKYYNRAMGKDELNRAVKEILDLSRSALRDKDGTGQDGIRFSRSEPYPLENVTARYDGKYKLGGEDFGEAYTIIAPGHPKDGSSAAADLGATQEDMNALARESVANFDKSNGPIKFSRNGRRAQEMGVKELGDYRINESRDKILKAVRDTIFNAGTQDLDDPEAYQTAHDLIRSLTGGDTGQALQQLKNRIKDHPELTDNAEGLDALAGVVFGEALRYGIRQATEKGDGRSADFSLFKLALDNYNKLPSGALKLLVGGDETDAAPTTRIARILASLQEVSKPMGAYIKWHAENVARAREEMLKAGFDENDIQALTDAITQIQNTPEMAKEVAAASDVRGEKFDPSFGKLQEAGKAKLELQSKSKKPKEPKQESESDKLIREVGEQVAQAEDFTDRVEQEGENARKGLSDELMEEVGADVAREEDFANKVSKQADMSAYNKSKDAAIKRLMQRFGPQTKKVATVKDITDAMLQFPEFVSNPEWRKSVVTEWLKNIGVDLSRMQANQLDALVATVFADAQAKMVEKFNAKREKKVQPTEMQKIVKAIKVGMATGAPTEWQTAFTEKFGMRGLTPDETRDVLHYSSIVGDYKNQTYNHQDRAVAHGKLANIFRRAGGNPTLMQLIAASYTQSALSSVSTQTLQFTQSAANWISRIYEDVLSGAMTGNGVTPILNAIQSAYDTYSRSFWAAYKNDNYREAQFEEIAKLTVLKTALERGVHEFKGASKLRKAALLPKIAVGAQDFFRQILSSADDAGVSGLRTYIGDVKMQQELRRAGISQTDINKLYDVAKAHTASLDADLEQTERPGYSPTNYRAWTMDEGRKVLMDSIGEALAEKFVLQGRTKEDAIQTIDDIDKFSQREAEIDIGVGLSRDVGSKFDLQYYAEKLVSKIEPFLRMDPKNRDVDHAFGYLLARMLLGFVRTPVNVLSRSVFRGPIGLYRLAITGALMPGKFSERASRLYGRTMETAEQQSQRRKEALVWTMTVAALYALARGLSGDDEDKEQDPVVINGSGPEDPQARDAWRAAGHLPNSLELNIGGMRISVPYGRSGMEPIKPALMVLGALDDSKLNGMASGEPENLLMWARNYAMGTTYTTGLFGLKNIASWHRDFGSNWSTAVKKAAYSFSPLLPFSGFTKSIGRFARPNKPDDKTLAGAIALSTPVFFIGEDQYNLYGDPVYGTPSSTAGKITKGLMWGAGLPFSVDIGTNPEERAVYEFSLKTGLAPSAPNRTEKDKQLMRAKVIDSPMNDAEWARYMKASGRERMDAMKDFVGRAEGLPEVVQRRNIEVVNARAERAGREALRK